LNFKVNMAAIFRLIKNPKTRQSAKSAIVSSVSLPDCGFISIDNSQGTSKAVGELCGHLDDCLNDLDLDGLCLFHASSFLSFLKSGEGDLGSQRRRLEERLTTEADKYTNSRLREDVAHEWFWYVVPLKKC
jgi:hypothetical protein